MGITSEILTAALNVYDVDYHTIIDCAEGSGRSNKVKKCKELTTPVWQEKRQIPQIQPELSDGPHLAAWIRESLSDGTQGACMRQTLLALLTAAALGLLGAPVASAGVTCQVVPNMCPPPNSKGNPVPEPGTLALLAAGVGAVGGALRRRRNKP